MARNGSAPWRRCVGGDPLRSRPVTAPPAPASLRRVRDALLGWYAVAHRDFPWRATRDPYAVLVSEVMLQQTQASRVVERFPRFMARFPSAAALAAASSAEVLAEWSGLGYNRRALSLQRAASAVTRDGWPRDVVGLRTLPGVGPYTARAVASLAFGIPAGVVDTNVRRWLLRRFAVDDRPASLQTLADALAAPGDGGEAATWTHASMEFGARICRARSPECEICPIAVSCPSRGAAPHVAVPRQAPLRGSSRAYRGAVLNRLATAPAHELAEAALLAAIAGDRARVGPGLAPTGWERILGGLERDGLVHRRDGMVRLGAATIRA
ncbi:MAG: A/G-specific adenine glycosylase [Chloroflexi bacterium]|nr:A/G-specific adenine glycosylase [Chloroflexota bacterium]